MNDNEIDKFRKALAIVRAHARNLTEAGADPDIVQWLNAASRHLASMTEEQVLALRPKSTSKSAALIGLDDAHDLSIEQVESALADETTTRRSLEAIAIGRFKVPKGSMRSFPNMESLREKLRTLAENEKSHLTIREIARRGPPRAGD